MQHDSLGGFGDARLERIGTALVASMQHNRTMCLHRLAKDRRQTRLPGPSPIDHRANSAHSWPIAGSAPRRW